MPDTASSRLPELQEMRGPETLGSVSSTAAKPDATAPAASDGEPTLSAADEAELRDWEEARGRSRSVKDEGNDPEGLLEESTNLQIPPQTGDQVVDIPFITPSGTPVQVSDANPFLAASPRARTSGASCRLSLGDLFAAGTIVLHSCIVASAAESEIAEDGWLVFRPELITPNGAQPVADGASHLHLPEPSPPRASPKKRRRSSLTASSPRAAKRARMAMSGDDGFDLVVVNVTAGTIRATARAAGDDVILRIYLVPQDLPVLADRRRPSKSSETTLRQLLELLRISPTEWNGHVNEDDSADSTPFLSERDERSLLEIYRDVESPSVDTSLMEGINAPPAIRDRVAFAFGDNPVGVSTELFPYQRATLAKMLARELAPREIALPTCIRRSPPAGLPGGRDVFVSTDGRVSLEPATVCEPRGGILAEDMGVGKTLITLALVMSTLSELPNLDGVSTYLDGSMPSPKPVLTTASSAEFPFPAEMSATRRASTRVPELLPGVVLDAKEQAEYDVALEQQRIKDAACPIPPVPTLRALALYSVKASSVRYSCPEEDADAPLPADLFELLQNSPVFYRLYPSVDQLDSREGRRGGFPARDIIVAPTTLIVVPTDLVRQWEAQIREHLTRGSLRYLVLRNAKDKFRPAAEMATFDLILMSVARFSDAADTNDTSLRGVHWKRLVIDEGHVLSNGNRMRELARGLRTGSRWAVSGTPSTNLRVSEEAAGEGGDRSDFDRLGNIFNRFLAHKAFPKPDSLRKAIQHHVHGGGERVSRLKTIFDRAIIRHRPEDIKRAFSLPPISRTVVQVQMEECERKVYNALIATFVSNAITSQRVDVDYLFHPTKRAHLDTLCDNLASATTFFGSSEFGSYAYDARKFAAEMVEGSKSEAWSPEEREKEHKVVGVLDEVLADEESLLTACAPSVAFEVFGLPQELIQTFRGLSAAQNPMQRTLVSANELVRFKVDLQELRHADVREWEDDEELIEELVTFEEKRKRIDAQPKNFKPPEDEAPLFKKRLKNAKESSLLSPLPPDSLFRQISLGRTTSAKMNHIIRELKSHPTEKFIIFSSSKIDLLFANLSEALDLLGIRHRIFAGGHARGGDRGSIIQHFNSTSAEECQAILVDAKLGGRGVNFTAASRIIMLEPIWQPDLELQAEKRAHRLGQTKPVDLQVLVVPSTFEHALLERRGKLAREDFNKKIKSPQQDAELRSLLQEARYLEPAPAALRGEPVSACEWGPIPLFQDLDSDH
ncbi:hypothetical protein JCM8202v2_002857 [Rhodotorula sphaerocarpa]